MSEIKLYIASSLDGYIARENGSLDWLTDLPNPEQSDYGYTALLSSIDTVVMGRNTYQEILGFGVEWPYSDCQTYVVSRADDLEIKTEKTEQVQDLNTEFFKTLKKESKKDVWLVGGGQLVSEFLRHRAIDEIMLCVIPVVLGNGIPLFPKGTPETQLDLIKTEAFSSGAVMLTYHKKEA